MTASLVLDSGKLPLMELMLMELIYAKWLWLNHAIRDFPFSSLLPWANLNLFLNWQGINSFTKLINTYCLDVEAILSELASNTDLPEVNFSHLETLAHQVEEKSMYIGAEHVRLACAGLIQACRQMHKRNFCCALSWTECEFTRTRNKFQACVQMEWKIMRLESKKRQK
ncbi:histidine-containing phosphotransfer protein 2 [Hevea brasiliensis]|uniref:histidine-containing phosphotransfer protein 2 n=1 Tax=Hevea brasiliensis TaxID=3981 RepID=UPI0025E603BF|nr:histidine-containing phosphotransfer protein 2 [Hevea brasiliensis]